MGRLREGGINYRTRREGEVDIAIGERRTSMGSGIITRMPYRVMDTCIAIKVITICMCM